MVSRLFCISVKSVINPKAINPKLYGIELNRNFVGLNLRTFAKKAGDKGCDKGKDKDKVSKDGVATCITKEPPCKPPKKAQPPPKSKGPKDCGKKDKKDSTCKPEKPKKIVCKKPKLVCTTKPKSKEEVAKEKAKELCKAKKKAEALAKKKAAEEAAKKKPKPKIWKTGRTLRSPRDPDDRGYRPYFVNHNAMNVPHYMPAPAFREFATTEEPLGPNANKDGYYKNPEYFAYHHYSFYDLACMAICLRDGPPVGKCRQLDDDHKDDPDCFDTKKCKDD